MSFSHGRFAFEWTACALRTNPDLERESQDVGACRETESDEEAIHSQTIMRNLSTVVSATAGSTSPIHDDPTCIVVDLDGTLIQADLLAEGLVAHIKGSLLHLFGAIGLLRGGKARLKQAMAELYGVRPDRLPYNEELLRYLRRRKQQGSFLVLATAADSRIARAVADEIGLFDEVIASSGGVNRRGAEKLKAIRRVIGEKSFMFIGDDWEDSVVFDAAETAILVDPPRALLRKLKASGKLREMILTGKNSPAEMVRLLRPHQWAKNLLILAPAVAGQRLLDGPTMRAELLAIVAFSLAASTTYILNDALDVAVDRSHPVKRRRPLASGTVGFRRAAVVAAILAAGSLLTAAVLGREFVLLLLAYLGVSTAYSLYLKAVLVVDLFALVSLYMLRLVAGHVAGHIAYSFWFMMFFFLMLTGLALLKRYSEVKMLDARGVPSVEGRAYRVCDAPTLGTFGAATMVAGVVMFALYSQSDTVKEFYSNPLRLAPLCAVVIFSVLRMWLRAERSELEKDPILELASDPYTYVLGAISCFILYWAG